MFRADGSGLRIRGSGILGGVNSWEYTEVCKGFRVKGFGGCIL